jgi:peptidyl-dipeptidase Dcp
MAATGGTGAIEAWDWRYWAEKVRQARYAVDDAEVKPYFPLEAMVEAAFDCAGACSACASRRATTCRSTTPTSRPTRCATPTADRGRVPAGQLRAAQQAQRRLDEQRCAGRPAMCAAGAAGLPVILNNNNFAKGAPGEPTLLSLDDARTLFHEFGHGLHGLLSDVGFERCRARRCCATSSNCRRRSSSTGSPSPRCCKRHARHWQTGEPIPDDLIARLKAARRFNQGYETVRYTASALVDMAVHARTEAEPPADLCAFEAQLLARWGLPRRWASTTGWCTSSTCSPAPAMPPATTSTCGPRCWTPTATTPSSKPAAPSTRRWPRPAPPHLCRGNSVEPGAAYAAFRGRAPSVTPLLKKRGLIEDEPVAA